MDYVKLNPKAEKCMRVNEIIKDVILLAAAIAADYFIHCGKDRIRPAF